MLKVELVLIGKLRFDLSKKSHSFNETIFMLVRVIVPFSVMIMVSLLTRPDPPDQLDQFYGKMRTAVLTNREKDNREIELTRANPRRFDYLKLFPRSNWEFRKWDLVDIKGILWSIGGIIGCILALYAVVRTGA